MATLGEPTRATIVRIQQDANQTIQQTRARRDLTLAAKRSAIAKTHREVKRNVEAIRTDIEGTLAARSKAARAELWGIADLATGPKAGSLTEIQTSYRDALSRASELKDAREAAALLAQAETTGDEILARAVAAQCYSTAANNPFGGDWQRPLDEYLAARPKKADALASLQDSQQLDGNDGWYFVVPAPTELDGLSDHQIDQLADDPEMGAA